MKVLMLRINSFCTFWCVAGVFYEWDEKRRENPYNITAASPMRTATWYSQWSVIQWKGL